MKGYLLILVIGLSLIGCTDKSTSNVSAERGDVSIIPPAKPVYPEQSNLTITVRSAGNDVPLSGIEVRADGSIVTSGAANVKTDALGKAIISLDQSHFSDVNKDGIADEAKAVILHVGGPGILSRTFKMMVTNYGENFQTIHVVKLDGSSSPDGVVVTSVSGIDLTAEPDTVINGVPVKRIGASSDGLAIAAPTVTVPQDITLLSDKGHELDTTSLKFDLVAFDVSNENTKDLLSVGMSYEILNPSHLADDMGVSAEEAQRVSVALMGVFAVNISDANGHQAKAVVGDFPVAVEIPLPKGMINTKTGNPVSVGDELAVLSLSEDANSWSYEGQYRVVADGNGNLKIRYKAMHFSSIAVGNVRSAKCTGKIHIVTQYAQPYSGVGAFTLEGDYTRLTSTYNGEGTLSYENITDEPLKIIFQQLTGSAKILKEGTTVEGDIEGDTSMISNVSPCAADGKTIVFEALEAAQPEILVAPVGVLSEGDEGMFSVSLLNPPVGKPVSFSLMAETELGDELVIEEKKYTFDVGVTLLHIPFEAPDDTKIEERQNFKIKFYDADNRAVFVNGYGVEKSSYTATISVIDNDKLKITGMDYLAVEEDKNATITFSLDQAVPENFTKGVTMFVKAYSGTTGTATEMLDYDAKSLLRSGYTQHGFYLVEFARGEDKATLSIPLVDDNDVDNNETFFIDMRSAVRHYSVLDFDINRTQKIRITDNDSVPDNNVTSYTVAFQRFGYTDSRLDGKSMWEGEKSWLIVTLDKAAKHPLTIHYDASPVDAKYHLSGDLSFAAGDATKYIEITAVDDDVTGPNIDFTVSFDSNLSGPVSQDVTILDNDFDYIYISGLNGYRSGVLSKYEGYSIQPEFYVYSNYTNLSIDYTTTGTDKSVSDSLLYRQGDVSILSGKALTDEDDDIVSPPRTYTSEAHLSSEPLSGSANFNVYIDGSTGEHCSLWNPSITEYNLCANFKQTVGIVDNDKYLFAIKKPGTVIMKLVEGSTSTKAVNIDLTLASEKLDRDVSFDMLDGSVLTLSEKEPKKTFTVGIPTIAIDPNLKVGDTGSQQFTVKITMTEESKNELQSAGLQYDLNTQVVVDINYTIIPGATTGAN